MRFKYTLCTSTSTTYNPTPTANIPILHLLLHYLCHYTLPLPPVYLYRQPPLTEPYIYYHPSNLPLEVYYYPTPTANPHTSTTFQPFLLSYIFCYPTSTTTLPIPPVYFYHQPTLPEPYMYYHPTNYPTANATSTTFQPVHLPYIYCYPTTTTTLSLPPLYLYYQPASTYTTNLPLLPTYLYYHTFSTTILSLLPPSSWFDKSNHFVDKITLGCDCCIDK